MTSFTKKPCKLVHACLLVTFSLLVCLSGCASSAPSTMSTLAYDRLTLYSEEQMAEMLEVMKKDPETFGAALYCKGEIIDAQKIPGSRPGCTSQECHHHWVTNPPTSRTGFCDGQVCPLDTTTWYPAECPGLYLLRCEVRLANISACM